MAMQFFGSNSLRAAILLCALAVSACGNSVSLNANSNPPIPSGTPPTSPGAPATPGSIALSAAAVTVAQTAGTVTLTVNRAGGSSGAASVNYATGNVTAIAGSNYTAASGMLTWGDADASAKTIAISLGATAFLGSKTFSLTLSSASGASLGTPASATITINGAAAAASVGPAAQLAAKLGAPSRLLVGLGGQGLVDTVSVIEAQALKLDIYERYLGVGDWTAWNSPPCDWICVVANSAASVGAIPMYTQYQMANDGDGNLAGLADSAFMATYWSRAKRMFTEIAALNKPALINFEPDFWGYAQRQAPGGDPTKLAALVNMNPDCATLANNVTGVAGCLLAMARKYAPTAYVGFPPSSWGGNSTAEVVAFMNAVGAQNADFVVEQTLDRDAGCREVSPQPSYCTGTGTWYWDESNQTHPNFKDHLAEAQALHTGIGNLPIIWWQTPEGVPSTTTGGTDFHYRDNRMHYFLTHPAELTAVGGLAIVFGAGENHQTNITTDGGQYQLLSGAYLAAPTPLP
jgi:hypothetical protein